MSATAGVAQSPRGALAADARLAMAEDDGWQLVEEPEVPPMGLDPVAWESPQPDDPDFDEAYGLVPAGDPVAAAAEDARLAARLAAWPPAGLLDATAPGPELAQLLAEVDFAAADGDQLVAAAAASARLAAWANAREVDATIGLLDRVSGWRGVDELWMSDRPTSVTPARMVAAELGAAMGLSPRSAGNRVQYAAGLARLPATRAALSEGRIDWARAKLVIEQTGPLDDATAAMVEATVMDWAADGRCYSELRRKLAREVMAADPAAAEARHQRKVAERQVLTLPDSDGMAQLTWIDRAETIDEFEQWLTGTAQRIKNSDGEQRSLDQIRADIMADLGRTGLATAELPTRAGRQPHLNVVVAATTLLGLDDQPGELAGYGPIPASVARRIAAESTWRRILVEPRTGRFDEMSVETYEPPQDMRDHVIARDRTCLAPGCRIPANRCDLDHHEPYPRGPTSPGNLGPFCRPFHEVKTFTDTVVEPDGNGGLWFTLPSGRSYHRPAEPVLDHPGLVNGLAGDHNDDTVDKPVDDDIPPF